VCGLGKQDDDAVLTEEELILRDQIMELELRESREREAAEKEREAMQASLREAEEKEKKAVEEKEERQKAKAKEESESEAPSYPEGALGLTSGIPPGAPDDVRAIVCARLLIARGTTERLAAIEAKREAARAAREDLGEHYRLICPACEKPNHPATATCTGCGFTLSPWYVHHAWRTHIHAQTSTWR
jgi:hypothetical protein